MRIYTKSGDLAFKTFTFPDGQPHWKLETYDLDFRSVTIEMALKCPSDLFMALLVCDVLRQHGYTEINLDVRYLMAARMDRAIDSLQPFTLSVVARLINGAGFSKVRILDAHSDVALRLIRNSENLLPHGVVNQVLTTLGPVGIVIPDKGATDRVNKLATNHWAMQCSKVRDPLTGNLSGFQTKVDCRGDWVIIDDICDGGGTFIGLAKELRYRGAGKVYLYVTHSIFSKGLPLEGIDHIYHTDSFNPWNLPTSTCIPISMKEMK